MSDERLRELEREAARGDPVAMERYLVEKIRVSPDLTTKLVRRMIRLERVIVGARANEDALFGEVSAAEFLAFLDRDLPTRNVGPGSLRIEGEDPVVLEGPRGGPVHIMGGRATGGSGEPPVVAPTNAQLHAMILDLQARVDALEDGPQEPASHALL